MQVFLETERLLLRRFAKGDVDNLFDLDGDPEVMRFVGGIPTTRDEVEHDLLPAYLGYYERGDKYGFWAAIEKPSGTFLGWFHLRPLEGANNLEADLGFRLRASYWGRGYATEGSRELIRKGFTELGVERVVASTFVDNLASRRVLEKAGMTAVRTFYHTLPDGEAIQFALDKAEWQRQECLRHG